MSLRLDRAGFVIQTRPLDFTATLSGVERDEYGWSSLLNFGIMTNKIDWLICIPWISVNAGRWQVWPLLVITD